MNRRFFLRTLGGAVVATQLPDLSLPEELRDVVLPVSDVVSLYLPRVRLYSVRVTALEYGTSMMPISQARVQTTDGRMEGSYVWDLQLADPKVIAMFEEAYEKGSTLSIEEEVHEPAPSVEVESFGATGLETEVLWTEE